MSWPCKGKYAFFLFKTRIYTKEFKEPLVRPTLLGSFSLFARVGKHSTLVFLRFKLQRWEREIGRNRELNLDG